jgi:hypothetical protein
MTLTETCRQAAICTTQKFQPVETAFCMSLAITTVVQVQLDRWCVLSTPALLQPNAAKLGNMALAQGLRDTALVRHCILQ